MFVREIEQFSEIRYPARAYFCHLFTRNIPNNLPSPSLKVILQGLEKISHEVKCFDALFVLDNKGEQIIDNISLNHELKGGRGENRSNKSYYYRATKNKRCILSDPYPSDLTNELCVTASMPVYNDKKELVYVVCLDISLQNLLTLTHPSSLYSTFAKIVQGIYACFSIALLIIALFLLILGVKSFFVSGFNFHHIDAKELFESTIILTLSLAIFDLSKTIFEEEVLRRHSSEDRTFLHKTMVRFLGSIIIALAIEALMLVFKFAITGPEKILYAIYLLIGVTFLLVGLSIYLYFGGRVSDRYN